MRDLPPVNGHSITKEKIASLVKKSDPMILEIGANDGTHTRWFLTLFPNPTVHCFEPDPRAARRFRSNIGCPPNVTLHKLALSDQKGIIDFYQSDGQPDPAAPIPGGWDLSGSILKPTLHKIVHPWCKFERKISVETTTLDHWAEQFGIGGIDFIWMDVQGAEWHVLNGAEKWLSKTRYIYTEYSNEALYEGQRNLSQLDAFLGTFEIMERYYGDVLFGNKKLRRTAQCIGSADR